MKKAILYLLAFLAIQVSGGGIVQGIWFLVSGGAEVGTERVARHDGRLIAVCPRALLWPTVIAHQLGHGRSHTAGRTAVRHVVLGTEVVVGAVLVPGDIA